MGYPYEFVYRKNQNKKQRNSGEILVYHKKELKDKMRLHDKTSENIIWLKASKGVVSGTKKDLHSRCIQQSQEVHLNHKG